MPRGQTGANSFVVVVFKQRLNTKFNVRFPSLTQCVGAKHSTSGGQVWFTDSQLAILT